MRSERNYCFDFSPHVLNCFANPHAIVQPIKRLIILYYVFFLLLAVIRHIFQKQNIQKLYMYICVPQEVVGFCPTKIAVQCNAEHVPSVHLK